MYLSGRGNGQHASRFSTERLMAFEAQHRACPGEAP